MRHLLYILLITAITFSCNKNDSNCKDFDATYNGDVKNIFERACNNGFCHVGSEGFESAGILIWFDSYENMLFYLENGRLEKSLFNADTTSKMPPPWADDRQLTGLEKEILKCWLDNGFPEN